MPSKKAPTGTKAKKATAKKTGTKKTLAARMDLLERRVDVIYNLGLWNQIANLEHSVENLDRAVMKKDYVDAKYQKKWDRAAGRLGPEE